MRNVLIRITTVAASLLVAGNASAQYAECPTGPALQENEILIAWLTHVRATSQGTAATRIGPFRAVALLKESKLMETDGAALRSGMQFRPALPSSSAVVTLRSTGSVLDRLGDDHCVYFADLRESGYRRFTLFSSGAVPGLRRPTAEERADFFRLNTTCVPQGDVSSDATPPCTRPRLLAVRRGEMLEYWATEPYTWDTGLTIWQQRGRELVPLIRACPGCSQ